MANWINVPGGPPLNFDLVTSFAVDGANIIFQLQSGEKIVTAYTDAAAASSVLASISSAVLNPTSGSPTIASVSPNSVPANDEPPVTITGTNFRTTASIVIGGQAAGGTSFVSSTTLVVDWQNFLLPAGAYDVVYSDGSGGADTLVGGFTIT